MRRNFDMTRLDWPHKTLTMLEYAQREASGKALDAMPEISLFDERLTDADAETWWARAPMAPEGPKTAQLHTLDSLRNQVMEQMPADMIFMSYNEERLTHRLLSGCGSCILYDYELPEAEILANRLWCYTEKKNGVRTLRMPDILAPMHLLLPMSEEYRKQRKMVLDLDDSILDTLHVSGLLLVDDIFLGNAMEYLEDPALKDLGSLMRHLKTTFSWTEDRDHRLFLIHDGMAEPEKILRTLTSHSLLTPEDLDAAIEYQDSVENPLAERLFGDLVPGIRPDTDPHAVMEDMILLAQQNVPLQDMEAVIASVMSVRPSASLLKTVRLIWEQTPRWLCLAPKVVS